jgi:CDGSH-type Zn-finger protein
MASKGRIRVTRDGPYLVSGSLPLTRKIIENDDEGYPLMWRLIETYPTKDSYSLCRCGNSSKKPYCDGSHVRSAFNRNEKAGRTPYIEGARVYEGPELKLTDKKILCTGAGFCTRAGNIWNLTVNSDNPEYRETAIQEANNCPSGRLVEWDKKNHALEPVFESSLAVTEDAYFELGPIWVIGGVEVESADGFVYEVRNRVTLCRCGKSERMPFCDGSHVEDNEEPLDPSRD